MLTQEDKARIEAIESYLEELYKNDLPHFTPVITPPKIEEQSRYVKCVKEPTVFIGGLKVGKVYKELSGVNRDSIYVIDEMGDKCGYYSDCFERVTEAEFLAQTAAQQEPKELINESKGERWRVEVYQPNITGNEGFQLNIKPLFKLRKPLADQAAFAIKELLKTL